MWSEVAGLSSVHVKQGILYLERKRKGTRLRDEKKKKKKIFGHPDEEQKA